MLKGGLGALGFASTRAFVPIGVEMWQVEVFWYSQGRQVKTNWFFFCDCWQFPTQPLLSPLASSWFRLQSRCFLPPVSCPVKKLRSRVWGMFVPFFPA